MNAFCRHKITGVLNIRKYGKPFIAEICIRGKFSLLFPTLPQLISEIIVSRTKVLIASFIV